MTPIVPLTRPDTTTPLLHPYTKSNYHKLADKYKELDYILVGFEKGGAVKTDYARGFDEVMDRVLWLCDSFLELTNTGGDLVPPRSVHRTASPS